MKILAIDPGDIKSGFVLWDGKNVIEKGKILNNDVIGLIQKYYNTEKFQVVIEMVASYGMPVGKTVFETCVWIGRFIQKCEELKIKWDICYRIDIKNHICHSSKAKDSNIIQALVDRFADTSKHGKYGKGTKNNKGFFYGFNNDIWQAFALAVYFYDMNFK